MAFATAFLVMLLAAPFAFANAQTTIDWTLGKDYSAYSTQSFKPGGTILFNYDSSLHNVLVVSKNDYGNCNTGNPIQTFSDGNTSITLQQGAMYFICGTPGHCVAGMKLQVNAADSSTSNPTAPTPTKSTPTTHSMAKSTPTSVVSGPATSPAPSPQNGSSSGAVGLSSGSHMLFAVPLLLVALFGFMF
ncbi:hypothetical protein RND81_11G068100 [Saponaria officinalis]|uniref:Phytocyanin domain-containing protein n=1 Tax=Saponaria officinalis TaxID=3572 RepID=A0AAW1HHS0_SAPOF